MESVESRLERRPSGYRRAAVVLNQIRRDGREAEGAPLLREYLVKSWIEGSTPSLSAIHLFVQVRNYPFFQIKQ